MAQDIVPAIVRNFNEQDRDMTVRHTSKDTVSFSRGLGDSGHRVQVVEHDCPADHCSFDRMIRRVDVRPEDRNDVRYWCLNPNCQYFVRDNLSYACSGSYPQNSTDTPVIFE